MKILTPAEVKQISESEKVKDIARLETTKKALADVQQQLNESEAKFELALANQRVRWTKEEHDATSKTLILIEQIKELEERKRLALIPIEREKEIAHNLFIQAEAVIKDARSLQKLVNEKKTENDLLAETLQERIDKLTDRETDLKKREGDVWLREQSLITERENIKKLSQELSIKLTKL